MVVIKNIAVKELEKEKESHSKVKEISRKYPNKPQAYITSKRFSNSMVSTLFNLRSKCENPFKDNFPHMKNHMTYFLCKKCDDSQ